MVYIFRIAEGGRRKSREILLKKANFGRCLWRKWAEDGDKFG